MTKLLLDTLKKNYPVLEAQSNLNSNNLIVPMIALLDKAVVYKTSNHHYKIVTPFITIDAEWDSVSKQWLCTQVLVYMPNGKTYLFFFAWEGLPHKELLATECLANQVNFVEASTPDNCLTYIMDTLGLSGHADLGFFYSAKDIEYSIGSDRAKKIYLSDLEKKRCIKGSFNLKSDNHTLTLRCRDAVGWTNKGFKELAEGCGVEMENKSIMDKYKANMLKGAEEIPIGFLNYALDDVIKLDKVFIKYPELIFWVQTEVLGIPKKLAFTAITIPMTQGSIVAKSFDTWIFTRSPKPDMLKFAIRKLGILKRDKRRAKKKVEEDLKSFAWASQSWTVESLEKEKDNPLFKYFLEQCPFEQIAYSGATIPVLAKHPHTDSTACFNAVVQGGRCNNEIPTEYRIDHALDIDLQSAYGSTLRSLIYPIGLPKGCSYSPNEPQVTLGMHLKKYESELAPGLWQIIVEGELPFRQDLVFSKDVEGKDINKAYNTSFKKEYLDRDSDDLSHIPGIFCLLRSEIVNGIITADILEVIRKVASNKELSQWMNLRVVCAKGWMEKDRCVDEADFINKVLADKTISANGVKWKSDTNQAVEENRPAYWYGIPLEEFIGNMVDRRRELKKQGKQGDREAASKQDTLKLFINTLYGVYASPYFPIGNAILANNITARARVGAWMISKALILRQTITDGGLYTPTGVAYYEGYKPGFTTLNMMNQWADYTEKRYIKPLANLDWVEKFEEFKTLPNQEIQVLVDTLASDHIETFWKPYGLSLKKFFNIEHKIDHTANVAAYLSKGHYAVDLLKPIDEDGKLTERLYRVRGANRYEEAEDEVEEILKENPIFKIQDAILDGRDIPEIPSFDYDYRHLLSLSQWQEAQRSNGFENYKLLMPGDEVVDKRVYRLNNNYFSIDTLKDYLSRIDRKKESKKDGITTNILWFEKYLKDGVRVTALKAELNKLL